MLLQISSRNIRKRRKHRSNENRRLARNLHRIHRREYFTEVKHCLHEQVPEFREHITRDRHNRLAVTGVNLIRTPHRAAFRGRPLAFIGYGLSLQIETAMGHGLKACMDFEPGCGITQYEVSDVSYMSDMSEYDPSVCIICLSQGHILTKAEANKIRSGDNGKVFSSHFASAPAKQFVINGYSIKIDTIRPVGDGPAGVGQTHNIPPNSHQGGVPLPFAELQGLGGGSFANHCDTPNAMMLADPDAFNGSAFCLFLVAKRFISRGEFIYVSYGKGFLSSSISNM